MSHSIKILSNDMISTGLGDILYSSYIVVLANPNSCPLLSSGTKLIIGPCGDISMILPSVLKSGFI